MYVKVYQRIKKKKKELSLFLINIKKGSEIYNSIFLIILMKFRITPKLNTIDYHNQYFYLALKSLPYISIAFVSKKIVSTKI